MTDSSVEAVARALAVQNGRAKESCDCKMCLSAVSFEIDNAKAALAALPSPEREPMREALEQCERGFLKHERFWRDSAKRTALLEDEVRADNAKALAAIARKALAPPTAQAGDRT